VSTGSLSGPLFRAVCSERGVMTTPLGSSSRRRAGPLDHAGLGTSFPGRALLGRQAPDEAQARLTAATTPQPRAPVRGLPFTDRRGALAIRRDRLGCTGAAEQELKAVERHATRGVQQPERADSVKPFGRDVLKEPPQEFRARQRQRAASGLATSPVQEGDCLVVLRDGLAERHPALVLGDVRDRDSGQRATRQVVEASSEAVAEGVDRDQGGLATPPRLVAHWQQELALAHLASAASAPESAREVERGTAGALHRSSAAGRPRAVAVARGGGRRSGTAVRRPLSSEGMMTIQDDERRQRWARDGLFVVRRAFDDAWVGQLASACDHALGRVRATSKETGHTTTNISPLLHPECFADRPDALQCLIELASSRAVVALVHDLGKPGEGELNLRDIQYFHEPKRDYDGPWHRDGVSVARAEAETSRPTVLRFRVALAADDHLEYVLGSHARPDTRAAGARSDRDRPPWLRGPSRPTQQPAAAVQCGMLAA